MKAGERTRLKGETKSARLTRGTREELVEISVMGAGSGGDVQWPRDYEVTCREAMERAFTKPESLRRVTSKQHIRQSVTLKNKTKNLPTEYSHFTAKMTVHQFVKFISHFPVDPGPTKSVHTAAMRFMLSVLDNHWLMVFRPLVQGEQSEMF